MSEKKEENLIIDALEHENGDLLKSLARANERLRLMKIELVQNRLTTGSVVIMNFVFCFSVIYWTTQ